MDKLPVPGTLNELTPYLQPAGRRLRWRRVVEFAARTAWLPLFAGALLLVLSRLFPIPAYLGYAAVLPLIWLLALPVYALIHRQSLMDVARRVDRELGLKERLSTALELAQDGEAFDPELKVRQRSDALAVAERLDPAHDLPIRWPRYPLMAAGAALAAGLLLVVLPNPMDAVLEARAAVAQAAEEEAERLEELAEAVEETETLDPAEKEALLKELRDLIEKLRDNRGDRDEALADVTELQVRLREKLDPQAAARSSSLESLAAQLAELAQAENQDPSLEEAAEMLAELAEQLAEMTPEEREALAQALEQSASRLGSEEASLAQALENTAAAARRGDARGAANAAGEAARAMAAADQDLEMQEALAEALGQAQESGRRIAQAGQQSGAQQPGDSQGGGSGQGDQPGQGNQPGQGGQGGQGNQPGQGNQAGGGGGTMADRLPPASRSGRAGDPTQPNQGYDVDSTVYAPGADVAAPEGGDPEFIPGQETESGETQTRESQAPQSGALSPGLVPYQDVFAEYAEEAAQAMEREYVPLNMRDYVREYFSQLEP